MSRQAVIASAVRTPIGSFQGALASFSAPELGASAIRAALERAKIEPSAVNQVIMGCVLSAGVGQAPARQASRKSGIPDGVGCLTVNKVCGSGLAAVMLAAQAIRAGDSDIVVAGGMESMSNVPYFLPQARSGMRLGHGKVIDGLIHDGLWDPYNDFHMGSAGEICAKERTISRERQDAFAKTSYERALAAISQGLFKDEIVALEVAQRKGAPLVVDSDEEPSRGDVAKLGGLRPAFAKDGTITAGNASTLNDGASALVVVADDVARRLGLPVIAKIVDSTTHAQAPEWFTTAPAGSIRRLLERQNLAVNDIDLWEINEAFSVVALANQDELGIDSARLNVRGGAVALGHPIGCSGARILTTLIHTMRQNGKRRGVASLCIGGGEAVAMLVENV
jgi:acetyl-CoA C-acetyltransferase